MEVVALIEAAAIVIVVVVVIVISKQRHAPIKFSSSPVV